MDALVKRRKALRTTLSKNINRFNEVFRENLKKSDALFEVIEGRFRDLDEINIEIFNLMLEEDKTDDEIAAELEKQDEYKEIFTLVKKELQAANKQEVETRFLENSMTNSTEESRHKTLRLPKVELMKFGGDTRDWLHFWSLFQTIDKELMLNAEEKFQYLFQSMIPESRAYEVVKSFPPTADNYPKALEELKSRFGRDGLLVQVYVRELLALVLKNCELGHKFSLMQFYDKLECQLRALELK